ncbi:MAG: exodeoxyribonuclease VII small subunit [Pikeienuella sp.]
MSGKSIDEMSFEEAMGELEAVVARLESGDAPLDQSIDLYERGAALRKRCEGQLKNAELRVEKIIQGTDGNAADTAPFDAT